MPASAWRFIDTPPAPGAWNMAVDEALMEGVRAGDEPALRFYRWEPACLSLGRNQPAAGEYDADEIRARGIDVVRRPTGGRAVLHSRELTYSVVMPDGRLGAPREAYAAINRGLVAGLRDLGVEVGLSAGGEGRAPVPSLAPCFREPAVGEVVAGGRKLVGSAQYREGGVTLQHGSLLLADDQSLLRTLLREAPPEEDAPAVLEELIDPLPTWSALTSALAAGLSRTLRVELVPTALRAAAAERARELRDRYADPAWTWRR